ncbi:MAG: WG repeat-containing protein [Planctomycetota bacterium]|jgi:hypothetical protein
MAVKPLIEKGRITLLALLALSGASCLDRTPATSLLADGAARLPKNTRRAAAGVWSGRWNPERRGIDVNGKWGFIDSKGRLVIPPRFEDVGSFSEDLAAVRLGGRYGYIDETGRMVVEPRFRLAFSFREGLAWARDSQAGFIDKTGAFVVSAPPGTYCREFRDGLAKTMPIPPRFPPHDQVTKIGFINKTGKYHIDPRFDQAWDFSEGLAAVCKDGKWGFVDTDGEYVLPPQYDSACYFKNGIAAVKTGDKTVLIDVAGSILFGREFDEARTFFEDMAPVKVGGRWGFMDMEGNIAVEPVYDEVMSFSSGRAAVKVRGKYGYIDKKGKMIIQPQFEVGHYFLGELVRVTHHADRGDGSWGGYVNRSGEIVWPPKPKDYVEPGAGGDK